MLFAQGIAPLKQVLYIWLLDTHLDGRITVLKGGDPILLACI